MTPINKSTARCPVCHMRLDPERTVRRAVFQGRTYYFCSPACQDRFAGDCTLKVRRKGIFSRFLDRLARAGAKEFGPCGPCCH
jgi:YHS domain-containing protein